jgi:esterase/lipase superfamily enzyme
MAVTGGALADLRFGLSFAASRYRSYAEINDPANNSDLFLSMAIERQYDADHLARVEDESGLAHGDATISDENAGSLLGLGARQPESAAAAAFRVQRAENTLARMAAQLRSLSPDGRLREALGQIGEHIQQRRAALSAARRRTQTKKVGEGYARGQSDAQPVSGQKVTVWFGTNRRCSGRDFLGERSENVTYGRCHVFVPEDRAIGSLGRGLIGRIIYGNNRVRLQDVELLDKSDFWPSLANEVSTLDPCDQSGLVFLHGYNTSFVDAARRTAQLKVDLGQRGPSAFFSWPSLGIGAGYSGDEAAIEGSESAIREFLLDFTQQSRASAVHIIAHFMGNRGLLRAMDAIANAAASAAPIRFGQIFLAAPDVDAQLFSNLAVAYGRLSTRATLYVTNNDRAIGLSRRLHRFARVGLAPPVAVVSGIDRIDASHVNLGLLGHSYAAEMRPVLADYASAHPTRYCA